MKKAFLICAALAAVFYMTPAWADGLNLDKVILNFQPTDKPIDNINVTNQNDAPLKVSVETVEVFHSDLPDQKEEATKNLIVAPKAFEIAPGETRPVRLIVRAIPDDLEAVYRVRFRPSTPTMEARQEAEGKTVQVNLIVTMGALIMVAPKNPKPELSFARTGDKITFTNKGNVTATLQRETFCTEDKVACAPLEGARIFPGAAFEMTVPDALKSTAFTQTVQINGQYSKLSYPAP